MKDNILNEKAFLDLQAERKLAEEHRRSTPVMDQEEIAQCTKALEFNKQLTITECRRLVHSLEIARDDAGELIMELEMAKALRKVAYREVVHLQSIRQNLRGCIHLIWIKLKDLLKL